MNLKKLFTQCAMLLTIIILGQFAVSCTETETTDSSNFTLYYSGITDIGPSMDWSLKAPSYIGGEPYDFAITQITHEGEVYATESFIIDSATGIIKIQNTDALPTGIYSLNVSCFCNGNYYEFKDAVKVNMLLKVPDGVTVTPKEVIVKMDEENWMSASAQVTTEKDTHVSIIGYEIAENGNSPYWEYFTVSPTGKITIKTNYKDNIIPGEKYILSLKLTTKAGNHLYPDAVTFSAISKPRKLTYNPRFKEAEKNMAFESDLPSITGSKEELKYAIKSVTPHTNAFTIDESTGVIRLEKENSLDVSQTPYVIDITVSNLYGSSDFSEAYSVKIVPFIVPIVPGSLQYEPAEIFEGVNLTQSHTNDFVGTSVTFGFAEDNTDEIKAQIEKEHISIDASTGDITVTESLVLAPATYDIKVKATNTKEPIGEATFKLKIKANPNKFTFVSYGTNLEHPMPAEGSEINTKQAREQNEDNRNQFRFVNRTNFQDKYPIMKSDLPEGATKKFEIIKTYPEDAGKFAATSINETSGEISLGQDPFTKKTFEGGVLIIKVTTSGQDAPAISKTIPVFFVTPKKDPSNETLISTPIVIKANPRTGNTNISIDHKVIGWNSKIFNGYKDMSQFILDYSADHAFYNFSENLNHVSGKVDANTKSLMYQIWQRYKKGIGASDRTPMSYYIDQSNLANKPAYINPSNYQVVINPGKWIGDDGKYVNGAVMAQIKYRTDGKTDENSVKDGIGVFSFFIWFDENF